MKKFLFITAILFVSTIQLMAQDYSNKGKEFFIAYTAHINGTNSLMGLYLTSDQNATGNIKVGNVNIPFTIVPKKITYKILGNKQNCDASNTSVYLNQVDGIKPDAGIKITSNVPIVVYAHIIFSRRSGATLVLPTKVLGNEYIIPSIASAGNSGTEDEPDKIPLFAVVATQDNTTIEFTPKIKAYRTSNKTANTTYQVTLLKAGDVYQFRGDSAGDLSGTTVKSISNGAVGCKPIAVFSGSTWSAFDCQNPNSSGGDNLYQQLFPYKSWGKKYITSPFIYRKYDIFRIYVKDPNTIVSYTENGVKTTFTNSSLFSGSFYQIRTDNPLLIEANEPISVAQFMTSQTCSNACTVSSPSQQCAADPEMILLSPVEQTLKNITFFSAESKSFQNIPGSITNVNYHYVNLIIDKKFKSTLKIDGQQPFGNFIDIPSTNYSYLQEDLTNSISPIHNVIADTGFSAIVYGTGAVESYGYNGGTNITDLYQYISLKNEFATVDYPATCKNTPFNFSITLPYEPLKLNWDFGGTANLSPNTNIVNSNPKFDTSFTKDGKTLYVYRLPGLYTFNQVGNYPIKVILNNPSPDGCNGEQEVNYEIVVSDKPDPPSILSNSNGCIFNPVQFQHINNSASVIIQKYLWDFGDGTKDSIKNPIKTFTTVGSFNIKHVIITDVGCFSDTVKTFTFNTPPTASFSVIKSDSICVGLAAKVVDFSLNLNPNIAKWYVDYGNGKKDTLTSNSNISTIYSDTGKYTISITVETLGGCRSLTAKKDVFVRAIPQVDFIMPAASCLPNANVLFTNQSFINSITSDTLKYKWYFGNNDSSSQKNGSTTYTSINSYNVKLIATSNFGCVAEKTKSFNDIYQKPVAKFGFKKEICLRDTAFFTDSSSAINSTLVNWNYDFGNGVSLPGKDAKTLYLFPKTYPINYTVISDKGCRDTKLDSIIVNPLPVAGFIANTPFCEKQNITFFDTSKANVGSITKWVFNMGDGTTKTFNSSFNSFTYKYDTTGIYNVRLIVANSKSCISDSSSILSISTNPLPKVGFTLPSVCLSDAFAEFNDTTKINGGGNFIYSWNFGDKNATLSNPNTSILQSPQHSYSDTGMYNVKLVVTSNQNCKDSITQICTVNGAIPKADFTVLNQLALCSNDSVKIKNTSTVDFGNITKVEIFWDTVNNLNHKTVDNSPKFNKIYGTTYNKFSSPLSKIVYVKMLSYSGTSCLSIKTISITLQAAPTVQFLPVKSICNEANPRVLIEAKEVAGFSGFSTFKGNGIINATTGLFNPKILVPNIYPIQYLFTSNAFGCKDSINQNITVLASPIANFETSKPLCQKVPITFIDKSSGVVGNIFSWKWNYSASDSALFYNSNNHDFTFSQAKNYTVTLLVTTDSGCTNSYPSLIKINENPNVNFEIPTAICLPKGLAEFKDSTTINDNTQKPFTYSWTFDDILNNSSILQNPSHNYLSIYKPQVKLIVTTANGCYDSKEKTINNIFPQPKASFKILPDTITCISDFTHNNPLIFKDESVSVSGSFTNWYWKFGNIGSSNLQSPNYSFPDSGIVKITFYSQDKTGCLSDTISKNILVNPYPILDLPKKLNFLQGGLLTINPIKLSTNNPKFKWTPNNNDIINDSVLLGQVFPNDDKQFKLTITNVGGCAVSDTVRVIVLREPNIPGAFSPNNDKINDFWDISNLENYPGCSVQVFDRFGRLVFQSNVGYSKPWNGRLMNNGDELPTGTYYYIVDPKNGRSKLSGAVTILR